MSRSYDYRFSDPAGSHITITTVDQLVAVQMIDGGWTYGYAIQSITGTFNGEAITGLIGDGGELQTGTALGYFSNTIYDVPGQGDRGTAYDLDSVGIVFQTTKTVYHLTAIDGQLGYEFNRQFGYITVASFQHPPAQGDTAPPELTGSFPPDHGVISPDQTIVLMFSEEMKIGTGTITISDGQGDTRVIDVHDSSQVYLIGGTLSVDPTLDLLGGHIYHISVSEGAFTDLAGNPLAAAPDAISLTTVSILTGGEAVLNGIDTDDRITGTATDHLQSLFGNGGDDVITLASGGGFAYGGAGNDRLTGGDSIGPGHFTGNTLFDEQGHNSFKGGNAEAGGAAQNFIHAGDGSGSAEGGGASGSGSFVYNLIDGAGAGLQAKGGDASLGGSVLNVVHLYGANSDSRGGQGSGPGTHVDNDLSATTVFGGSASDGAAVSNRLSGSEIHAGVAHDLASHVDNNLTGTAGADRFVFTTGGAHSVINDFTAGSGFGHDFLDLRDFGLNSVDQAYARIEDVAGSAVIHLDQPFDVTQDIVLHGVLKSILTADDFILLA